MAQAESAPRPLDPRLLRRATAAGRTLGLGALIALLQTLATIAFAGLLAWVLSEAIAGNAEAPGTQQALLWLLVVVAVRGLLAWAADWTAIRGSALVKAQLRRQLLTAVAGLGGRWAERFGSARLASVSGQGLDALDAYFAKFLPQLLLAFIATPAFVIVMFWLDWPTGLTVILTIPLIPIFMILIGMVTQAVQQKQWRQLTTLSGAFLDAVAGLTTLKLFRREHRQAGRIRALTDEYRKRTLQVLRVSFLSGFVLELAASLAVALVAVSIGVRLIEGDLSLFIGLFALLIAPEAYLPLRAVGAQFHASAEGVAAAQDALAVLDAADAVEARHASLPATVPQRANLTVAGLCVGYDDAPAVMEGLSFTAEAGSITSIAGPSGSGKSTLIAALLGFVPLRAGVLRVGEQEVTPVQLRAATAWAGQSVTLLPGTVAENLALGSASPCDTAPAEMALEMAGLAGLALDHTLDAHAAGLSGGQGQRLAVARAVYRLLDRDVPVLILDEPTAALDAAHEATMLLGLRRLAQQGKTVIVVTHRPAVLAASDRVISLESLEVPDA